MAAGDILWTPAARGLSLRAHFGANHHPDALGTHYFALFNGKPDDPASNEAATGGYARAAVANDAALWGSPALGDTQVQNQADIVWPAAYNYIWNNQPFNWWGIFDHAGGGTLWYMGHLSQQVAITQPGDQPRIMAHGLTLIQA